MMLTLVKIVISGWKRLVARLAAHFVPIVHPRPLMSIGPTLKILENKMNKTHCIVCSSNNVEQFNVANYCLDCGYIEGKGLGNHDLKCPSCHSINCGLHPTGAYCLSCGFPFLGVDQLDKGIGLRNIIPTRDNSIIRPTLRVVENNQKSNVINMIDWKKRKMMM